MGLQETILEAYACLRGQIQEPQRVHNDEKGQKARRHEDAWGKHED